MALWLDVWQFYAHVESEVLVDIGKSAVLGNSENYPR